MRQAVRCARLHWVHSHMGGEASLQFWSAEMHFDLVERSARTGMERIVWHLCKPKEWQSVKGKAATFLSKRKKEVHWWKDWTILAKSLVRWVQVWCINTLQLWLDRGAQLLDWQGCPPKQKVVFFFFFKWSVLVKRSISLRVSLLIGME